MVIRQPKTYTYKIHVKYEYKIHNIHMTCMMIFFLSINTGYKVRVLTKHACDICLYHKPIRVKHHKIVKYRKSHMHVYSKLFSCHSKLLVSPLK